MLQKLAEDNLIKNITLVLKSKELTKEKIINFVCDPSIDVDNTIIKAAVEQAKLKYCMSALYTHDMLSSSEKLKEFAKFKQVYKAPYQTPLTKEGVNRQIVSIFFFLLFINYYFFFFINYFFNFLVNRKSLWLQSKIRAIEVLSHFFVLFNLRSSQGSYSTT